MEKTTTKEQDYCAAIPVITKIAGKLFRCPRDSRIAELSEWDDYLADCLARAWEDWPSDGFGETAELVRFVGRCVNAGRHSDVDKHDITARHRNSKRAGKVSGLELESLPVAEGNGKLLADMPTTTLGDLALSVFALLQAGRTKRECASLLQTSWRQIDNAVTEIAAAATDWLAADEAIDWSEPIRYRRIVPQFVRSIDSMIRSGMDVDQLSASTGWSKHAVRVYCGLCRF